MVFICIDREMGRKSILMDNKSFVSNAGGGEREEEDEETI